MRMTRASRPLRATGGRIECLHVTGTLYHACAASARLPMMPATVQKRNARLGLDDALVMQLACRTGLFPSFLRLSRLLPRCHSCDHDMRLIRTHGYG